MKSKIILFFSIFTILFFSSCEKTIDFNGEIPNPLMVLNCVLTPDSTVKIHITKSKFFLSRNNNINSSYNYSSDNNFTNIENAVVSITINGGIKTTISHIGSGYYESSIKVKPLDIIRIEASAPTLESVWSEVTVEPQIKIISIDTTWTKSNDTDSYPIYNKTGDTIIGNSYYGELKIKIKFQDNSNEKNYYKLKATKHTTYSYIDNYGDTIKQEYDDYYSIEYDDIVFGNSQENGGILNFDSNWYGNNLFSDDLINGKEYSLSIKTRLQRTEYFPGKTLYGQNNIKDEISINLQHLSKGYYLYLKTTNASNSSNEIFSEPVQIFNNIEAGMGILGSYTNYETKIEL